MSESFRMSAQGTGIVSIVEARGYNQDGMTPSLATHVLIHVYSLIKDVLPSWQISCGVLSVSLGQEFLKAQCLMEQVRKKKEK